MDRLLDFGLAGLVFLALVIWLVRKIVRAARTESDLEGERLTGAFADELRAGKALASGQRRPRAVGQPPDRTSDDLPESPLAERVSDRVAFNGLTGTRGPRLVAPPLGVLEGADVRGATAEHLGIVASLAAEREATMLDTEGDVERRLEVLWVKSTATHAVWCERRHPATRAASAMTRDVICVALVEDGKVRDVWRY